MPSRTIKQLALLTIISVLHLMSCHSAPAYQPGSDRPQEGSMSWSRSGEADGEDYITVGDTIRVYDVNHPSDINLIVEIGSDGTALFDQIGRITIAGYTRSDLEVFLTERYTPFFESRPNVVVGFTTKAKGVFVLGEVASEGSKLFKGNQNVFDVVQAASPRLETADIRGCLLIRGDPQDTLRLPFNLEDIAEGDTRTNYPVAEGDILWVPSLPVGTEAAPITKSATTGTTK